MFGASIHTGTIFSNVSESEIFIIFYIEPPDLLPLSFGRDLMNEGDFAQVSCIVSKGDEPLSISWSFHGNNISSDPEITTMPMGARGSALIISSVGHKHRGNYTCQAKNDAGKRFETVELKVNGKKVVAV